MRTIRGKRISYLLVLVLLTTFLAGCTEVPKIQINLAASEFAPYEEVPVKVMPGIEPYQVADSFANVANYEQFQFPLAAREPLQQNSFVVVPGDSEEFFQVYDDKDGIPNFITTDAMLHTYHLYFNHLLTTIEKEHLFAELKELTAAMLTASEEQYSALEGTAYENAARRNIAFFAVAGRLLNPWEKVPVVVRKEVKRELALIEQHSGIEVSPVANMGNNGNFLEQLQEDYTQYIPRGHYTLSKDLENYFKTMMWYGRMTFRLKNEDETRSAVLMSLALNEGDNISKWKTIYETSNFFVGKSDGLEYYQYSELLKKVYGNKLSLSQLTSDTEKWKIFLQEAAKLEPPAINSIPVFDKNIQPDTEKEIKGFRFMGQRYTLDADIFQQLIYDKVKENKKGDRRMLPRGLDIPAAMGSEEAYRLLEEMGETGYQNYPENMNKMKEYVSGLDTRSWTKNLYCSWLYNLLPLIEEKSEGYPSFMLNQAWTRKELNTYLGSWTELKHDTILYAKQPYAKCECAREPQEIDEQGYVEPNPCVYARLASLVKMTREGLEDRGFLNNKDKENLSRMENMALSLKNIAEKELNNQGLNSKDYELIRSFGKELGYFWGESLPETEKGKIHEVEDNPAALIADVASDPENERVLEEGIGYISEIYVVVSVNSKLQITRGGVYSYYEFPWPSGDRLTNEKWHKILANCNHPQPPEWTKAFTTN